ARTRHEDRTAHRPGRRLGARPPRRAARGGRGFGRARLRISRPAERPHGSADRGPAGGLPCGDSVSRPGTGVVRARRLPFVARPHHERWADERELAPAICGTVVGAAAMAVASVHGTLGAVIVTVLVTVGVYWAAERYAEVLAAAVHGPDRRRRLAEALR